MISLYLPQQSWAHRLNPRAKLLALAVASLLVLPVDDLTVMAGLLASALLLYASLGRTGLAQVRLLRPLATILLVLLAIHAVSGTFQEGVVAVLRLVVMVLLANFVTVTTRMDDMLDAIRPLFVPLEWIGLSSRRPALALTLILRFAPVLLSVYGQLQDAYQARTGRRASWRLIAPFALQALKMSENVAEALSARGGADGLKN